MFYGRMISLYYTGDSDNVDISPSLFEKSRQVDNMVDVDFFTLSAFVANLAEKIYPFSLMLIFLKWIGNVR